MGMTLHRCNSPISTTHSPNLSPFSPQPPLPQYPQSSPPRLINYPPPPFSMARRKLARSTTTTGSIASYDPDMVSALSSPLPPPPASPPPSAFPGEKRPSHEDKCEEEEEQEEAKAVKRAMSTSREASSPQPPPPPLQKLTDSGNCGRERLQRHRNQVAGSVWIPDVWEKEDFLKDWTDCVAFDRSLVPSGLVSAKSALIEECRRSAAGAEGVRINLGAN